MSADAHQKRLKRHVIGRIREYFAVTTPGLEEVCRRELHSLLPDYGNPEAIKGGVVFRGRLDDCMRANLLLRTPNRILMRVATFKASNFLQLQKKIDQIPWEIYLQPDVELTVQTHTRHCRLHHTAAISDYFSDGIENHLGNQPRSKGMAAQLIMIRGVDDRFTASLDSSGELLYRRGIKSHAARAPLRETTAAAALMLAGFRPSETLLDPMCGSGTFALEAAMQINSIPPGWFRDFAFFQWPAFRPERWRHIRQQLAPVSDADNPAGVIAADSDPAACRALEQCLNLFELGSLVRVINQDFFEMNVQPAGRQPGLLVLNPPYGKRLGSAAHSNRLFRQIIAKMQRDYPGWKFCLIVPRKKLLQSIPFQFKSRRISHGGLKIYITYGRII